MMKRTARELNLPSGDAVLRDGQITILPAGHKIDRLPEIGPAMLPNAITTNTDMTTSQVDRARGYRIMTAPLSAVMGVLSAIVAWIGVGVPIASMTVLAWFGTAYAGTWLASYLINVIISPDGTGFIQMILGYRLIRHDQRERHQYYRSKAS